MKVEGDCVMASLKTMNLCKACKNGQPYSHMVVQIECGITEYTCRLFAEDLCGSWSDIRHAVAVPVCERLHVVACDKFERAEVAK